MSAMGQVNFLGIPVGGIIIKGDAQVEQRPLFELEPLIRALLDDETILSFGWSQYTPYFMDGDPCIFSANELWVKTAEDATPSEDEEDEDNEGLDSYSVDNHPTLGEREYDYRTQEYGAYVGSNEARYDNCHALDGAIQSGHFDNVLLEAFGDHAEITVKRTGILVSMVSHD